MRIGMGYDVHRLVEDRELIIGGVKIPFDKGLLGHSDADVLTHAVVDALLGAMGLGDIGTWFPDTSDAYKDIDSFILLREVNNERVKKGYEILNIDATIIAQKPKMLPYIPEMRKKISAALAIDENQVNIKATTTEGLSFEGEGKGISSQVVVLLKTL